MVGDGWKVKGGILGGYSRREGGGRIGLLCRGKEREGIRLRVTVLREVLVR